jgi:hypothetical protein
MIAMIPLLRRIERQPLGYPHGWSKGQNEVVLLDGKEGVVAALNAGVYWTLIDVDDIEAVAGRGLWTIQKEYVTNTSEKHKRLHRFLLDAPDNLMVDHINRNTLDNRRANLRLADSSTNSRNRTRRKHGTVYRSQNSYVAHISRFFDTEEEARNQIDQWVKVFTCRRGDGDD